MFKNKSKLSHRGGKILDSRLLWILTNINETMSYNDKVSKDFQIHKKVPPLQFLPSTDKA